MRTKHLFIIQMMAAAVFLCSCSSDDNITAEEDGAVDDYLFVDCDQVPIRLGVGPNSIVETRGTGIVGSISTDTMGVVWRGESFKVLMLEQNSLNPTLMGEDTVLFDVDFKTPDNSPSGSILPVDNVSRYFPADGCSDFWAYHLDDAQVSVPHKTDTTWAVDLKIDGTQDVMVAKAIPTSAQKKALGKNKTTWYYSTYSARKGLEPAFQSFRHLMTRLKFYVVPTTSSAVNHTSGITVTKIAVSSFTQGSLAVAGLNDTKGEKQLITWNDAARDTLLLKQRDKNTAKPESAPLVKLDPLVLRDSVRNRVYPIGESMLVAPDSMYVVKVYFTKNDKPYCSVDTLYRNTSHSMFAAGYSYNIRVRLSGNVSTATARSQFWEDAEE